MGKMKELFQRREEGKCPFCGKDMSEEIFRDIESLSEFRISGLCQDCQDSFFKGDYE